MNDWCIKWVAKISEEGQANGLPSEVYAYSFMLNVIDPKAATAWMIENESKRFSEYGGLPVEIIPAKLHEFHRMDPNRRLIPFHWIVELAPIPKFIGNYTGEDNDIAMRH